MTRTLLNRAPICALLLCSAALLLPAAEPPSLFLIGDSITKTGGGSGGIGPWGMGWELIPMFDSSKIHVYNEALGGRSSRSYIEEGLWSKVLARVQAGDFVLIMFGHNDSAGSVRHPDRHTLPGIGEETAVFEAPTTHEKKTIHTYGWYLRQYVRDIRAKGATPILCSPAPRATWVEGRIKRGFDGYASWAADVARLNAARFIDLNTLAANRWDALGQQKSAAYFSDLQHVTKPGARVLAESVVEGLRQLTDCKLAESLLPPGTAAGPWPPAGRPAVYLVGDSSAAESTRVLTNQGWGVPFLRYFDPMKIEAVNAARGGRSSRTYITEGLLDAVVAKLKPGDTVLIQLGHNDVFPINDDRVARGTLHGIGEETEEIDNLVTHKHEVVHTYGWYLRKFVTDVRSKGAEPVVLTLTIRYRWNPDGTIERLPKPDLDTSNSNRFDDPSIFSVWAKEVAMQVKAPLIDLHNMIADRYDREGRDTVSQYFNNPGDPVHTNPMGAKATAELAIAGLKALKGAGFAEFLSADGKAVRAAEDRYVLRALAVK